MPEEKEYPLDPGSLLAIQLINDTLNNGDDVNIPKAMKALGEAAKANLQISCKNNAKITKHVDNNEVHTPKGILVRSNVIGWFLFLMILISSIVTYVPELLIWLKLP